MAEGYQALYRTWRPQSFADLVGQPHVTQTLTNAIRLGQVAHAYLFCGPRGTGKTSAAKVLAKAVNCLSPVGAEPCNECTACRSIRDGINVDVEEIDAASNRGVDEIRQLRDKVQYAPANLKRKVYIVDEVHMLTPEAFNALLKTLEEPPAHALFVLATTEPHKIPGTIVSRCQRFDFRRISLQDIRDRLEIVCKDEGWSYDEDALWRIAETADGGLRDALGLLEQTGAYGGGNITTGDVAQVTGGVDARALLALVEALWRKDVQSALQSLLDWYSAGKDAARIVHDVVGVLRDILVVKLSREEDRSAQRPGYRELATLCELPWLLTGVQKLGETYVHLRFVDQPRLALEIALLELATWEPTRTDEMTSSAIESAAAREPKRQPTPAIPVQSPTGREKLESAQTSLPEPRPQISNRKKQVLKELKKQENSALLGLLLQRWERVLSEVQEVRSQAYGWLKTGTPVLVTEEVAVLAFAFQPQRNAVMKPTERAAIEQGLSVVMGRPLQILALLRTDWEQFCADADGIGQPPGMRLEHGTFSVGETVSRESGEKANTNDLVSRAINLFGRQVVEVRED